MKRLLHGSLVGFVGASLVACSQGANAPTLQPVTASLPPAIEATPASPLPVSAGLRSYTYRVGPFALPAQSAPERLRDQPGRIAFAVEEPLWMTAFEPQLEDRNGNVLPESLLHLAIVANHGESNPLCAGERTGLPIAATTSAHQKITLPTGYGYAIVPTDRLETTVWLRNPTDEDYSEVYFRFTVRGEPMDTKQAMQDVLPLLIETDPCGHQPLAVEPGGYVTKQTRVAVPTSGHLVAAHGLLQDFGVEVTLTKESEAVPFWKAAAVINAEHQVTDLPQYADPAGVPFQSGEGLVLSVAYQNFSDRWFNNATTAAMVYFARGSDATTSSSTAKPYQQKSFTPATTVQTTLLQ